MIKRDTIQRIRLIPTTDEMGGQTTERQEFEYITVAVSISATLETINQFGVQKSYELNVVSNAKLDEYVHTRYVYSGKVYKLMRQMKRGNEYFSIMREVNE